MRTLEYVFMCSFKIIATIKQYRNFVISLKITQIPILLKTLAFSYSAIKTFTNITLYASMILLICVGAFYSLKAIFINNVTELTK